MTRLSLALLGPTQLTLDGQPVGGFAYNKARALLAYLAVEADRPHHRDTLAALLWPELPDEAARHNLRQALTNLRTAIGDASATPPFLYITRDTIQFNPASDHELDVANFTALLAACNTHAHRRLERCRSCAVRMEQAIVLYRGDFLAGFSVGDSASFEEWQLRQRERLHQQALDALIRLADYHERRGDDEPARRYAQRQIELEPWREEAHRQLMRLLARGAQRSAALAQYETCRRILERDLGVEPEAETTALYERIRDTASSELLTPKLRTQNVQNFPAQTSLLIGRETEVAELGSMLENPACRLITIVGAGGIGKTRLALAAATEQAEVFADGAAFVPLQVISTAAFLAPVILSALDIPLQGQREPRDQLLDYLRGKELLLVLDNVEQLLASDQSENDGIADLLSAILARAPGVTLLVTSRERLALPGEWLFDVSGLSYPPGKLIEGIEDYGAVQLFVQRAGQVRRQFRFTDGEARAVARICQLVEGLPLAIELATAALRTRSCAAIADAIETSLSALASGLRAIPERHRSMWATFEHSWHLLSDEERQVFPRLSVFRGGFEEDAAAQVAQADPQLLASLVDKSLLRWDGAARYDMHELVRQYASEKLHEVEEPDAIHRMQALYFLALVEQAEPALRRSQQQAWVERLEMEHDNLRAALTWAVGSEEAEVGLRLAGALTAFWEVSGHHSEGRRWCAAALARSHAASATRITALLGAGWLAGLQADYAQAQALGEEALRLALTLDERPTVAAALFLVGFAVVERGDAKHAYALAEESLALSQGLDNKEGIAHALELMGWVARAQADLARAQVLLEESVTIFRELGNAYELAIAMRHLGIVVRDHGDNERATLLLEESLAISREQGSQWQISDRLLDLGALARDRGDYGHATALLEESLAVCRRLEDTAGIAEVLHHLGETALLQGDDARATALEQESLRLARNPWPLINLGYLAQQEGDHRRASGLLTESLAIARERSTRWYIWAIPECLAGIASVASRQGQLERAARLFGAAEKLHEAIHNLPVRAHLPEIERTVAAVRAQLGEDAFVAAWDEGRAMSLEQAIASALSEADSTAETQADAR